jgi:farnesyl diphosphate synthase
MNAGFLPGYLKQRKALVDRALDERLPGEDIEPRRVHAAMRAAVLNGGKRLRPVCSMAVAELAGAAPESVLDAACAVELAHAASLILDDLPCMDDAQTRRGRPCTHLQFDEATAILASMGLLGLAFELAARNASAGASTLAISELARAIGTRGLVYGQHLDLSFGTRKPTLDEIERMHHLKAGALFLAALRLPGLVLGIPEALRAALDVYGRNVGLAFQITDDLLDEKHPGEDEGKSTMVTHLGAECAAVRVDELIAGAITALEPFGERGEPLRQLAAYVRIRNT